MEKELYKKLENEMNDYKAEIREKGVEYAIDHAYELTARQEIIDSIDLKELQRNIYDWSKKTNERYPIQIKTSPLVGVWLFRIRNIVGNILRKIKK